MGETLIARDIQPRRQEKMALDTRQPGRVPARRRRRARHAWCSAQPVLVNGTPGFLVAPHGRPLALIGIAIRDGKITEIDILADPERLSRLDLTSLISSR